MFLTGRLFRTGEASNTRELAAVLEYLESDAES